MSYFERLEQLQGGKEGRHRRLVAVVVLHTVAEARRIVGEARHKAVEVEEAGYNHLGEDMENGTAKEHHMKERHMAVVVEVDCNRLVVDTLLLVSFMSCMYLAISTYVLVEGPHMGVEAARRMAAGEEHRKTVVEEVYCNHLGDNLAVEDIL